MLTFTKHFLSAGHQDKCFTLFIEEETEAQKGLSNFLKITRLEVASCDLKPSFFASRASAFTACETTLLFWNSLVFKNSQDWVISPVLPKHGCVYRSPRGGGLVNADFNSEVLGWDPKICICHPCSDSSDAAGPETTLCSASRRWTFYSASLDTKLLCNLFPFL